MSTVRRILLVLAGMIGLRIRKLLVGLQTSKGRAFRMELTMGLLELSIAAFIISLIAAGLGFTGVARGAASIAKVAFGIFLVVAVILLIMFALGVQLFT